mmetsp:Transcript_21311/g.48396  ORF Transcript_21311/g.48396 Transcript_21311/m.48396 type:complete len:235 (+) Transcript_21311:178-882(+)
MISTSSYIVSSAFKCKMSIVFIISVCPVSVFLHAPERASHNLTTPSDEDVYSVGCHACQQSFVIPPPYSFLGGAQVCLHDKFVKSHTLTIPSNPPVAHQFGFTSALQNPTASTPPAFSSSSSDASELCTKIPTIRPTSAAFFPTCKTHAVPSPRPARTSCLSAPPPTTSECTPGNGSTVAPCGTSPKTFLHIPVLGAQTLTVPSIPAVMALRPSAVKAPVDSAPSCPTNTCIQF